MDEDVIEWLISDTSVDELSQLPNAAVVFMLVYGLELSKFLLKTSNAVIEKFPLRSYDVGGCSVYLAGSCAHGLYPNTHNLDKDIDVVIRTNKFDIREECHYDKGHSYETLLDKDEENEEDRNYCESETVRLVHGLEQEYLNVERWKNTPPGYVMIRKCRKRDLPTLKSRYVSSKETTDARETFWKTLQSKILQPVSHGKQYGRSDEHEPILAQIHQGGPAVNAFLIDDQFPMTLNLNTDLVFSLPYPGWPEEAESWFSRKRKFVWPPEELVEKIRKHDVEMVPIGHENSPMKYYEWRLSFTRGELLLSRSLKRVQREIIHIMKAVTQTKSYDILNLMYWESEETDPSLWLNKNIAKMLFHMLDKLTRSIKNKHLPHYFAASRNLLDRFLQPMIEMNFQEIPMDEYLDFYMLPIYQLRLDPLGKILKQTRFRSLPWYLTKPVFWQFVQKVKSQGVDVDKRVYVDTLTSLAKAHLNLENFDSAHAYANDANSFYVKLGLDFNKVDLIELLLTVTVCSYLDGHIDSALNTAKRVEGLLPSGGEAGWYLSMRFSDFGADRIVFYIVYGRILALSAKKPPFDENTKNALKIFSTLTHTTASMLDHVNLLMRVSEYDEAYEILNALSSHIDTKTHRKWYESSATGFEQNPFFNPLPELSNTAEYESNVEEVIYDRKQLMKESDSESNVQAAGMTERIFTKADDETSDKNSIAEEQDAFDRERCVKEIETESLALSKQFTSNINNVHVEELTSLEKNENEKAVASSFSQNKQLDEEAYDDSVETVYNRKSHTEELIDENFQDSKPNDQLSDPNNAHKDMDIDSGTRVCDTEPVTHNELPDSDGLQDKIDEDGNSASSALLDEAMHTDDQSDSNNKRYLESNYNYMVKLCTLAKEYERIGMREKGQEILNLLISKCQHEYPTEEHLYKKIKTMFYDTIDTDEEDTSMNPVFSDVFGLFRGHMTVTTIDIPILDDILATIVRQKQSPLRISPKVGLYHFRIQYFKALEELEKAKAELKLFAETVSEITDDSQLILGQHYAWFGHTEKAEEAFIKFQRDNPKQRPPTEQVLFRAEQLLKVIQHEEPFNPYLDDLFH